jgi:Phytanoyl-CoA dioxygenase (PhyH)
MQAHGSTSIDALVDEAFWRASFPALSIGRADPGESAPADSRFATAPDRLTREGYFQGRDEVLGHHAPRLADAVERCVSMGIPPAFVFLFDEAWECFGRLRPLARALLGDGYLWLPDFWAWHVSAARDESGWRPHRDRGRSALRADGAPISLTLWIPLTDATPDTSCIYAVPADRDPTYATPDEDHWQIDLPNIRALPALPGEFLCWNQALLHWGSRASPCSPRPRMSMALECQRGDAPPFNTPLLSPRASLSFTQRLTLVVKQVLQYRHMVAVPLDLDALAKRLARRPGD